MIGDCGYRTLVMVGRQRTIRNDLWMSHRKQNRLKKTLQWTQNTLSFVYCAHDQLSSLGNNGMNNTFSLRYYRYRYIAVWWLHAAHFYRVVGRTLKANCCHWQLRLQINADDNRANLRTTHGKSHQFGMCSAVCSVQCAGRLMLSILHRMRTIINEF